MQDFLVKVYARPVRDGLSWHWCSRCRDHPEAVSRLEALWKGFEVLRRDPGTGTATWWRDYADPTMAALSDAGDTFTKCSDTTHAVPPDLPVERPSDWLLLSDSASLSEERQPPAVGAAIGRGARHHARRLQPPAGRPQDGRTLTLLR